MRFSFWPLAQQTWDDILFLARHAERTGWHGVWFADHFMPNTEDAEAPCHEVWTVLSALAASVPRIRIGPLVLGNTYRHPAVVANMAASLDHISGGRLVLGMGAGWQQNEHTAYGIELYSIGERLRVFEEACRVIKALLNEDRASFQGRYYRLDNAPMNPKPLSNPLPLMSRRRGPKSPAAADAAEMATARTPRARLRVRLNRTPPRAGAMRELPGSIKAPW